jgi:hypothetical protein
MMGSHPLIARSAPFFLGPLVFLAMGCASWRVTQKPPGELLADRPHRNLRVTVAECPPVVLRELHVSGDTLYGRADQRPKGMSVVSVGTVRSLAWEGERVVYYNIAVPQEGIQKLELQQTSVTKTALLVAGIGLTVASIVVAIVNPGVGQPPSSFFTAASSHDANASLSPTMPKTDDGHPAAPEARLPVPAPEDSLATSQATAIGQQESITPWSLGTP